MELSDESVSEPAADLSLAAFRAKLDSWLFELNVPQEDVTIPQAGKSRL